MITQTPISLKINSWLLDDLDKEVALGWKKRNTHINEAIRLYLKLLDGRRHFRSCASLEDKRRELIKLVKIAVPEVVYSSDLEKYIL